MDYELERNFSFGDKTSEKLFFNQNASSALMYNCSLNVFENVSNFRNTGIVCTIGPACREVQKIQALIRNGMEIARFNFSHGDYDYHGELMKNVREAAKAEGKIIAFALDTKGPEIRTGVNLDKKEITLKKGDKLVLTSDVSLNNSSTAEKIYIDYPSLCVGVKPGQRILVADGSVILETKEVKQNELICEVISGATFGSRKNVGIPGVKIDLPALSDKDKEDIKFGMRQQVDIIFASFIRNARNVMELRELLDTQEEGKNIKIISKIENCEGVEEIDGIIAKSDGVMVARGDLGTDMAIHKVTLAQKMIIARCNRAAKPVICATQMLESMITCARPTRAEVSDVTNAILDGSDCVMLSGETANGSYPDEVVLTMDRICREAEMMTSSKNVYEDIKNTYLHMKDSTATAMAASSISFKVNASMIIVLSTTGSTAALISHFRPRCPIVLVTRFPQVARQANLYRGIIPLYYEIPRSDGSWSDDVEKRLCFAISYCRKNNLCRTGSKTVFVSGWKSGPGTSNSIRVLTVGEGDTCVGT